MIKEHGTKILEGKLEIKSKVSSASRLQQGVSNIF